MRCREEELSRAQVQQQIAEKHLKQREQDLEAREMELLRWELNIIMQQQQASPAIPTPNKRRGHFKKSNILKMLKKEPNQISSPSGNFYYFYYLLVWTMLYGLRIPKIKF